MPESLTRNPVNVDKPLRGDGGDRPKPTATEALPQGGHCLVTAGVVSSGKSTLQHALIHRLYTDERIDLTFHNEDGKTTPSGELLTWINRFDRGEFPERTRKGIFQTFFIQFGEGRRRVKLSFFEISGEDFQAIVPQTGRSENQPHIHSALDHILTTSSIGKLFVFVADTTRHDPTVAQRRSADDRDQRLFEDMMFSGLLRHFRTQGLNRIRVLFAATKWDAAYNRNLHPERFFREHFPQTRAALRRFEKSQVQYIRFTVGNVQTGDSEADGGGRIPLVEKRDTLPIGRVVQWIYTHATGKYLAGYPRVRPSLLEKIIRWAATT